MMMRMITAGGIASGMEMGFHLLRRAELAALFGEPILAERFGGLVKSWIALRPVG